MTMMTRRQAAQLIGAAGIGSLAQPGPATAEPRVIRISRGFGAHYLPFFVMEDQGLLQKHATAAGLAEIKVEYPLIDGAPNINDAMLAGSLDFATTGMGGFLTLWAKTRGSQNAIIGLGSSSSGGMIMTSRNPAMKTLRDISDKDRIAVPGIKTSLGATILHMAVAKEFGDAEFARFDHLTVGLPYPEAVAAMISGKAEVTAHVASAPFSYMELDQPGIHKVFNSVDLFGHLTVIMAFTTERFRAANPELTGAFVAALKEAAAYVDANKPEAAKLYARMARVKTNEADILRILQDPDMRFSITPAGTMTYANFMHRVGTIKTKPVTWTDMFVPELHGLAGG